MGLSALLMAILARIFRTAQPGGPRMFAPLWWGGKWQPPPILAILGADLRGLERKLERLESVFPANTRTE